MDPHPVLVGAKGRVVLPAPIRRALGLAEGSELLARVEDGAVVLEPRAVAVGRLQALVRASVPERSELVGELLAERRAEARRERRR
jgi:antitoxin PrlF